MRTVTKTALIMAAGTGGHIFPGLAIAEALTQQGFGIVWLATPAGMEHKLVGRAGYPIEVVAMSGVRGKGAAAWLKLPLTLLRALTQSAAVLRRIQPAVVVSMGGYIAFPGGVMAALKRIPLVVHEPGAHAGLTSRALALFADRVLVGFPHSFQEQPLNRLARLLPKPKRVEWLGTPVRAAIAALPAPEARLAGRSGRLRLLVVGGSLGAKTVNELVVAALQAMPAATRPQVVHQAGEKHAAELAALYQAAGVEAEVLPFIDDMAARYGWCDLLICRAGAITVAEITAAGIASLLIPLPWFVAEEQRANAQFLADAGAGMLIDQRTETAAGLAAKLTAINREQVLAMASRARALGKPDATVDCARVCAEVAK
ncbi:MAG: undecaprenyldiphospho-muramoylpentapeptide beta-N-acetylglucosaminyltransferase [Betaproteobacteria bacterium]|nr:undecaprenyldiphospho-muramoylpentapeptide beta-N-acetylglucosaminyltransferase [Betaproteobacteria bacterium]